MASIQKRSGGSWRAPVPRPGRHGRGRHIPPPLDPPNRRDEQTAYLLTRPNVRPEAGKVTFRECAESWRLAQVHRPSTQAHTETMLRRHVYPTFGDRPVGSILPSEIQAWVKRLTSSLAPSTVAVVHGQVSGVFKAAVLDRRINVNPCESSRLPKASPTQIVPLTIEAVRALEAAASPRWQALITLAAGSGLRNGECLGLTVDRIDFLRRTVRIDRQMTEVAGKVPTLAEPKTDAASRTIPLPRVVVDTLAAHLAEYPPVAVTVPWRTGGQEKLVKVELLFPDDDGGPMRRTRFSRAVWVPARSAAKLPDDVTSHDLRHFYASLLIRHGESVKTVQARLGHASAAETLDTSSHLWPDSDDRTREAVEAVLGAPADSTRTAEGGEA
jgi:integrase